ncbi:hypothetical protein HWV62_26618 [Athelia sp. TMB]|nr:hypothetical protein HWV62_26618 [Athelia sp. TMB]
MDAWQIQELQNVSARNYTTIGARDVNNVNGDMITENNIYHNPEHISLFPAFVVQDAAYNSHTSRTSCLNGTRGLVISTILKWKDDYHSQPICWLSGAAGLGKSAVLQSIAESCANDESLVASFFFLRGAGGRSEFRRFITTLAFQLTLSVPEVKPIVAKALQDDPTIPHQSITDQLQKLILRPLAAALATKMSSRVLLVIVDALDECDDKESVRDFICTLANACSDQHLPLRWLFTSRGEQHIRQSFSNEVAKTATHILTLEMFNARTDIKIFLRARFSAIIQHNPRLFRDVHLPWPSPEELRALVEKSYGLFIFASTLVNFVTDGKASPERKLRSVLQMHAGLDPLYEQVLRDVPEIACFRDVLTALMLVYEQPSVRLLAGVLQLSTSDVLHALMAIQSIIHIPSDDIHPIQLNHTSLRDFLVDKVRSRDLSVDPQFAHGILATNCARFLFRDMRQDKFPIDVLTLYAVKYLPRHLEDSNMVTRASPELCSALQDISESPLQVIEPWINTLIALYAIGSAKDRLINFCGKYMVWLLLLSPDCELISQ